MVPLGEVSSLNRPALVGSITRWARQLSKQRCVSPNEGLVLRLRATGHTVILVSTVKAHRYSGHDSLSQQFLDTHDVRAEISYEHTSRLSE